ncbi:SET domain [Carpediemonas membranifera]|uniref:SET domain n=1 Tax=Carpediemonas membranifera TaxID=201153 RepID=A0A8J6E3F8_9EUKA|nr:SET domain [Carpediemonas membranifera]|eukprot:KAG9393112.1 SET domain [Carpediemonas membranifera]
MPAPRIVLEDGLVPIDGEETIDGADIILFNPDDITSLPLTANEDGIYRVSDFPSMEALRQKRHYEDYASDCSEASSASSTFFETVPCVPLYQVQLPEAKDQHEVDGLVDLDRELHKRHSDRNSRRLSETVSALEPRKPLLIPGGKKPRISRKKSDDTETKDEIAVACPGRPTKHRPVAKKLLIGLPPSLPSYGAFTECNEDTTTDYDYMRDLHHFKLPRRRCYGDNGPDVSPEDSEEDSNEADESSDDELILEHVQRRLEKSGARTASEIEAVELEACAELAVHGQFTAQSIVNRLAELKQEHTSLAVSSVTNQMTAYCPVCHAFICHRHPWRNHTVDGAVPRYSNSKPTWDRRHGYGVCKDVMTHMTDQLGPHHALSLDDIYPARIKDYLASLDLPTEEEGVVAPWNPADEEFLRWGLAVTNNNTPLLAVMLGSNRTVREVTGYIAFVDIPDSDIPGGDFDFSLSRPMVLGHWLDPCYGFPEWTSTAWRDICAGHGRRKAVETIREAVTDCETLCFDKYHDDPARQYMPQWAFTLKHRPVYFLPPSTRLVHEVPDDPEVARRLAGTISNIALSMLSRVRGYCYHPGLPCSLPYCQCMQLSCGCGKFCSCFGPKSWCKAIDLFCNCNNGNSRCVVHKANKVQGTCSCAKAQVCCDPDLCMCSAVIVTNKMTSAEATAEMRRLHLSPEKPHLYCAMEYQQSPKVTVIGKSGVHGFGLFAGEDIPPHSHIIQYSGELLDERTADFRGRHYSHVGSSYLFRLTSGVIGQSLDANWIGNKSRFANHQQAGKTVFSRVIVGNDGLRKVVFVSGAQTIPAGTELLFDYGYSAEDKQTFFTKKIGQKSNV